MLTALIAIGALLVVAALVVLVLGALFARTARQMQDCDHDYDQGSR